MVAHLKEMPRPPIELAPALGPDLNAVIMKAIAKSPADRYQSADDFRHALTAVPAFAATLTAPMAAAVVPPMPAPSQTPTVINAPTPRTGTVTPLTPERIRTLMDAPAPSSSPVPAVPPVPPVPQAVMRKPANAVLYMAIGGVVTVSALVYAGWYISSATASPTGAAATTSAPATTPAASTTPATAPATPAATTPAAAPVAAAPAAASTDPAAATTATPAASTAPATTPAEASPAASAAPAATTPAATATSPAAANSLAPAKPAAPARTPAREATPAAAAPATPASPTPREAAPAAPSQPPAPAFDFDALEEEIDQLAARAVAINRSLDNLQREQARQGLGLRGDIAARQQSMNTNLNRAEEALAQRNAARAQRLKAQAEADLEALEKFLGR